MAPKVRLSLRLRRRSVIVAQTITKDQSLEARIDRKRREKEKEKKEAKGPFRHNLKGYFAGSASFYR